MAVPKRKRAAQLTRYRRLAEQMDKYRRMSKLPTKRQLIIRRNRRRLDKAIENFSILKWLFNL